MADKQIHELTTLSRDPTSTDVFAIDTGTLTAKVGFNSLSANIAKVAQDGVVANVYSTSGTYAVGDYCIYNGGLYRCNTAIPSGEAWTAAHWTAVTVGADLKDAKVSVDGLITSLPTATATGNPISISDAAALPAKALSVTINPIQSGSGTPSINNVRPITGLSSVTVTVKPSASATGTTYTVSTGTAGTVYGGTLDVKAGTLTVTHVLFEQNTSTMNNSENWPGWNGKGVRDILGTGINDQIDGLMGNYGSRIGVNTSGIADTLFLPMGQYDNRTQTDWIALAVDVQFVLPLASPVTYTLTPTEVELLLDDNIITSNAGSMTLTYYADPFAQQDTKVDKYQGTSYAGKPMVVDTDGVIRPGSFAVPEAVSEALLACFEKVAWVDDSGESLYNALETALYGTHQINAWYYPFNGSLLSSGTHELGFTGVANYTTFSGSTQGYFHNTTSASTDPLGIKAINISDEPAFSGSWTISFWYASQVEGKGRPFEYAKYVGSGWSNISHYFSGSPTLHDSSWQYTNTNASSQTAGVSNSFKGTLMWFVNQDHFNFQIINSDGTKGEYFSVYWPSTFLTAQWHHYAFTMESNTLRFFCDGNLILSVATTDNTLWRPGQIALGSLFKQTSAEATDLSAVDNGDKHHDFFIADYCKWTSAFDPTEIVY